MPTCWAWWAGIEGDQTFDLAIEQPTRQAALAEALRNADKEDVIVIVEARMSTDRRYEGDDFVPFTHTRNREVIGKPGLASVSAAE